MESTLRQYRFPQAGTQIAFELSPQSFGRMQRADEQRLHQSPSKAKMTGALGQGRPRLKISKRGRSTARQGDRASASHKQDTAGKASDLNVWGERANGAEKCVMCAISQAEATVFRVTRGLLGLFRRVQTSPGRRQHHMADVLRIFEAHHS
jgi:hypothetical protein